MAQVDFYFDFSCPWTYLAYGRLLESAMRTGAGICWKPINQWQVLELSAGGDALIGWHPDPRRAAYQRKNLDDWAWYCGIKCNLPAAWPEPLAKALNGAVHADRQGKIKPYAKLVFSSYFGDGRDVKDLAVLRELAEESGLQPHAFCDAVQDFGIVEQLNRNATELVERGGFRSATMFVNDSMYVGNESMPLVEFALGQASDIRFVAPGDHAPV